MTHKDERRKISQSTHDLLKAGTQKPVLRGDYKHLHEYTLDELKALPAGGELDVLVFIALGGKPVERSDSQKGYRYIRLGGWQDEIPDYSTAGWHADNLLYQLRLIVTNVDLFTVDYTRWRAVFRGIDIEGGSLAHCVALALVVANWQEARK